LGAFAGCVSALGVVVLGLLLMVEGRAEPVGVRVC
jgi:hypothetical protein